MYRYRQYLFGFLIALGFAGCYQGYQFFKEFQLMRQQHAAIVQFLAEPTGKNDKGEVITRADVLAAVAKRVVDVTPPVGNPPSNPPKGAGTP